MTREESSNKKEKEIMKKCKDMNLQFIKSWIGTSESNKKRQRYVEFICEKHARFGSQVSSWENYKRLSHPCSYCNHRNLKDIFKEEVESVNPYVEIIGEYRGWETDVSYRCKMCGELLHSKPRVLMSGGSCGKCKRKMAWDRRRYTRLDIQKLVDKISQDIDIVGEYDGYHEYIKCKCKVDNHEWQSIVANIVNGTARCPVCSSKLSRGEVNINISKNSPISRSGTSK